MTKLNKYLFKWKHYPLYYWNWNTAIRLYHNKPKSYFHLIVHKWVWLVWTQRKMCNIKITFIICLCCFPILWAFTFKAELKILFGYRGWLFWTNSTRSSPLLYILQLTNIFFQRGYFVKFGGKSPLANLYFGPCFKELVQIIYFLMQ